MKRTRRSPLNKVPEDYIVQTLDSEVHFKYKKIKIKHIDDTLIQGKDPLSFIYRVTKKALAAGSKKSLLTWKKEFLKELKVLDFEDKELLFVIAEYIKEIINLEHREELDQYTNQLFENMEEIEITSPEYKMIVNNSFLTNVMKEGIEKGRQEGIEKGIEKGREEGISEATKKIALTMIDKVEMPLIIECTGLTSDEILDIKHESMKN